jgi:hypothetical protein
MSFRHRANLKNGGSPALDLDHLCPHYAAGRLLPCCLESCSPYGDAVLGTIDLPSAGQARTLPWQRARRKQVTETSMIVGDH